jgi:hypothetical protein
LPIENRTRDLPAHTHYATACAVIR